ncbi:MAG TPA: hypothetical protein VFV10_09345 [Gammaproteobacteria bacterium]|nr:hypothetical protein [Gammaproteobacteria bacterium]
MNLAALNLAALNLEDVNSGDLPMRLDGKGVLRAFEVRCRTARGRLLVLPLFALGLAISSARASGADLADSAVRIEYGFYSGEDQVVSAAAAELGRIADGAPAAAYLRGLAALRLAELAERRGADPSSLLGDCVEAAGAAAPPPEKPGERAQAADRARVDAAEALALAAACETLLARREPIKGVLHARRRDQDLAEAQRLDPGNPRAALVQAWGISREQALSSKESRAQLAAALGKALAAFDSYREREGGFPGADWGEPEALAELGELRLLDGDRLAARDLVERALLAAPDYWFAVELEGRLAGR